MCNDLIKVEVGKHTLIVDANELCDMFYFAKMRLQDEFRYCTSEAEQENNLRLQDDADKMYNFFVKAKNDCSPLKTNGNGSR